MSVFITDGGYAIETELSQKENEVSRDIAISIDKGKFHWE